MNRTRTVLVTLSLLFACTLAAADDKPPIRVGWIGSMTGPVSRYNAYQSALLAMEDINAAGGIKGRPLKLLFEDGKGEGKSAAAAAQKLIAVDGVRLLIGGHCSPESLPISSIVQQHKVVMLAAITSSPKLTTAGDYVFRVSPVSTIVADKLGAYAFEKLKAERFAILFEETDYAQPVAERLKSLVEEREGVVTSFDAFTRNDTDFRGPLLRVLREKPDVLYIGSQSPELAVQILRQARELGVSAKFFGNEITGNAVTSAGGSPELFEGLVFADPDFNLEWPATAAFIERYKARFKVSGLPMGFWSAEAYDAVRLLASTIERCGEEPEAVKKCLYEVTNYEGVSGSVSIDRNGDGQRKYLVKVLRAGKAEPI